MAKKEHNFSTEVEKCDSKRKLEIGSNITKNNSMHYEADIYSHYHNLSLPPVEVIEKSDSSPEKAIKEVGTLTKRQSFESNFESIKSQNIGTRNKMEYYPKISRKNKITKQNMLQSVYGKFTLRSPDSTSPMTITNKQDIVPYELHSIINDPRDTHTIPAPLKNFLYSKLIKQQRLKGKMTL